MKLSKYIFICLMVTLSLAAKAANDGVPAVADNDIFNSKINAWAEGTVLTLDADGGKFTIRGTQRPYATQYAKMMQEIQSKTAKLSGADRDAKAAEIRKSWFDTLEKARVQDPGKDSDFTFRVTSKNGMLHFFDESRHYGMKFENAIPTTKLSDNERTAMLALKDLRVGDFIVVGYASGVINNDAFIVVKANKDSAHSSADRKISEPAAVISTSPALGTDTENARLIRRALVADKSLSTAAHNVRIDVKDGVAHLRGDVLSETEKKSVEDKAAGVVGSEKIMSHLEVSKK